MPNHHLAKTLRNSTALEELYHHDPSVALSILSNPYASKELLINIVSGLPSDGFSRWLGTAPFSSLMPLFQKLSAELFPSKKSAGSPVKRLSTQTWVDLIQRADVTAEFLSIAANATNPLILAEVAAHPRTFAAVLDILSRSDFEVVLIEVAKNPNTPKESLAELVKHKELSLYLAQNPRTPESVLRVLLDDYALLPLLAKHPNTPAWMMERLLLDGNREVHRVLASNPKTPAKLLGKLFQLFVPELCSLVLRHPSVPASLVDESPELLRREVEKLKSANELSTLSHIKSLERLLLEINEDYAISLFRLGRGSDALELLSARPIVSSELALFLSKNESTPVEMLEALSLYPVEEVRLHVARHRSSSAVIFDRLLQDESAVVRETAMRHEAFSAELHLPYAKNTSREAKLSLLSLEGLSPDALAYLVGDHELLVRQVAFLHANFQEEDKVVLSMLQIDPLLMTCAINTGAAFLDSVDWQRYGPWVRMCAAKQQGASESLLSMLLRDLDLRVQHLAAEHPSMSTAFILRESSLGYFDIATWFATSETERASSVRRMLSQGGSISFEVRESLERQTFNEILELLQRPLSPGVEARFVGHIDPNIRVMLAQNETASPQVLSYLASDPNGSVRLAVASNPKTPDSVLFSLLTLKDARIFQAAQITIANKLQDHSSRPGWLDNAPREEKRTARINRPVISERTVRNIKKTMLKDPTLLTQRVSQALQRSKEK